MARTACVGRPPVPGPAAEDRTPAAAVPPEGPPTFLAIMKAVAAGNPRYVAEAHMVLSKKDHEVLGDSSGFRQWLREEVTLWLPKDT